MSSRRVPKPPAVAAVYGLQKSIAAGELFHAYLLEGSRQSNEALADWFTAAALCEKQDGGICGECANCRGILDGVSPFVVKVRTAAETEAADERFEKRLTEGASASKKKASAKSTAAGKTAAGNTSQKIKDEQIEEVITRSLRTSLTGGNVITIIDRAETITPKGQNRLLKTLEEPPEGIVLILMTSNAEALLDTIRSRCLQFRTDAADTQLHAPGKPAFRKRAVEAASALIRGTPAFLLWKEMDYFAGSREKASDFCETAELFFRDVMLHQLSAGRIPEVLSENGEAIAEASASVEPERLQKAIRHCETAARDLNANVSMKHALRSLMFSIQLDQGG